MISLSRFKLSRCGFSIGAVVHRTRPREKSKANSNKQLFCADSLSWQRFHSDLLGVKKKKKRRKKNRRFCLEWQRKQKASEKPEQSFQTTNLGKIKFTIQITRDWSSSAPQLIWWTLEKNQTGYFQWIYRTGFDSHHQSGAVQISSLAQRSPQQSPASVGTQRLIGPHLHTTCVKTPSVVKGGRQTSGRITIYSIAVWYRVYFKVGHSRTKSTWFNPIHFETKQDLIGLILFDFFYSWLNYQTNELCLEDDVLNVGQIHIFGSWNE